MGFSATPTNTMNELEALLDIGDKLSTLLDKNKMQETIKLYYGLSTDEKAQADEARSLIAEYQGLVEDNRKKKAALDAFNASLLDDRKKMDDDFASQTSTLEKKKADIASMMSDIANEKKAMDDREKSFSERESAISKREADIAVVSAQNVAAIANIKKERDDLELKKKDVADYEASLKATASQLQNITQGLK